jgi:predicted NBD/HSP70 family sugar kinase
MRPGVTRAEVAGAAGLSTGTASDLVAGLIAAHALREGDPAPASRRGRPTRTLWPHPDGPLVVVAAIAHEAWEVETLAIGGGTVARHGARHRRDAEAVLDHVRSAFADLWDAYGRRIRGFAVSVPGTVAQTRLVQASNLGWRDLELSALRPPAASDVPFYASNDATYSAIAESRRGAARDCASLLHLLIDSGIGGALIDSGRLTTGAHGMAGEFGHMPFGARDAACRCGARGCWNTELDGPALAHELGVAVPDDEVSFSRAVVAAARAGHDAELAVACRAAAGLGRGIAGLVNALDPELVVLGGLAAALLEANPDALQEAYRGGLMSTVAVAPPRLVAGELGDRGPLVGAMETAFEPVLIQPLRRGA